MKMNMYLLEYIRRHCASCVHSTRMIKHLLPSLVHAVRLPPEPDTRPSEDALKTTTSESETLRVTYPGRCCFSKLDLPGLNRLAPDLPCDHSPTRVQNHTAERPLCCVQEHLVTTRLG